MSCHCFTEEELLFFHTQGLLLKPTATQSVLKLPRGGEYITTKSIVIQYGIPPETVKDCLKFGLEVPKYYIIPG